MLSLAVGMLGVALTTSPKFAQLEAEGRAAITRREELGASLMQKKVALSNMFLDEATAIADHDFPLDEATLISKVQPHSPLHTPYPTGLYSPLPA